jgi:hypothetical protein
MMTPAVDNRLSTASNGLSTVCQSPPGPPSRRLPAVASGELHDDYDGFFSNRAGSTLAEPDLGPETGVHPIDRNYKLMSVRITSARWYTVSLPSKKPTPGPGVLGMDLHLEFRDHGKNASAKYFASFTTWGLSWSQPYSDGRTTGPGEWREFRLKWKYDLKSIEGMANITVYTIMSSMFVDLGIIPSLLGPVCNVHEIGMGPLGSELPSVGTDRYDTATKLIRT